MAALSSLLTPAQMVASGYITQDQANDPNYMAALNNRNTQEAQVDQDQYASHGGQGQLAPGTNLSFVGNNTGGAMQVNQPGSSAGTIPGSTPAPSSNMANMSNKVAPVTSVGGSASNIANTNMFLNGSVGGNTPSSSGAPAAPAPPVGGIPGQGSTPFDAPGTDVSAYLDPSMAFQLQQGTNAIDQSHSSTGSLMSGQTLKDLQNYAQGLASTDYNQAFQNQQADLNRTYGVDNADRNFAYTAQTGDRAYNTGVAEFGAQQGLSAAQSNAQLQAALAAILSQNAAAAGQAQGTGTIGANNGLTGALSTIIQQMYGQNTLNQLQGILQPQQPTATGQ